eukprot:m.146483 g.146483  ORF g.146483 m.146483 type:complete len:332 (-) comp16086_c4_seq5:187-1182(-)
MASKKGKQPAIDPTEALLVQIVLASSPYMRYRPLLLKNMDPDLLADELMTKNSRTDFCWCVSRDSDFLQRACRSGFLPIASPIEGGVVESVVLPKLHQMRCVMTDLDKLHVGRSTRKHAKKWEFSIDVDFDGVLAKCIEQHGMNWIGLLASEFRDMFHHPSHGVQLHSIEVWEGDQLVAGELGWSCGSIYTSATGFSKESGAGAAQLCALGRLLKRSGFAAWDLGMGMKYKFELGAENVRRVDFVTLLRRLRDKPCKLECPRMNARDVIDGPSSEAQATKLTSEQVEARKAEKKRQRQASKEKQRQYHLQQAQSPNNEQQQKRAPQESAES